MNNQNKSNERRYGLPGGEENTAAISDTIGSGEGYLYRFRDLVGERADWVRQIVVDSQLYLSSPARFNDPFDCQARYQVSDPEATQAAVRARAAAVADQAGMPRRERRRVQNVKVNPDKLLRDALREAQKAINRDIRVLSLAATHENILMWSHYACGHQGICLQFRLEADRGFFAGALRELGGAEWWRSSAAQADIRAKIRAGGTVEFPAAWFGAGPFLAAFA